MIIKISGLLFISILIFITKLHVGYCDAPSLEKQMNDQITIVFSGEENGYLKPCGCTEGQLGGIKRRFEYLKSIKKEGHIVLPISLGDIPGIPNRQNEIKMEIMLKAMEMMGYVVHNLGEKDLAMGYDIINYLSQISKITFISSNVRFIDVPETAIKPYLIKKIKTKGSEVKIAFIGILSPDLVENDLYNIEILDPIGSLRPLVKKLDKESDLLILLSHADKDTTLEIADTFPELDLVISGHEIDEPYFHTGKGNDTLIASVGEKGKYVGVVRYFKKENSWNNVISKNKDLVKMIPLGNEFNRPSEADMFIDEYKTIVKQEGLLGKHQKVVNKQGEQYTGNLICGTCHTNIFADWKETKHFRAYETLQKDGDQFDPECVKCHVVGFDYSTGFKSIDKTPGLKGVGCESCHGFGSIHVTDTTIPYKKDYQKECAKCHDPENSPHFEYATYWKKIKHPHEKIDE
ncbi:MAG: multiheme c-type cytochrome [Candidatus Anammoxibacter sp.]